MYCETKKVEAMAEEQLEALPEWNEVPDLMMETGEEVEMTNVAAKRKRDEVAQGQRKRWKEDEIRAEKRKHLPSIQKRSHNPAGFYSKDWDESQQVEDDRMTG